MRYAGQGPIRVPEPWNLSLNTRGRTASRIIAEALFESEAGGFSIVRAVEPAASTDWSVQGVSSSPQVSGWIHWARVFGEVTAAQKWGNVWAVVGIEIGSGSGLSIISDYVSGANVPSWPFSIQHASVEYDRGRIVTITGTDPAAGAEVADTVPTRSRWDLIAAEVVLVTDGTAANRNTALFIDDAGATVTRRLLLTDTTNQTATQTRTHGWYPGTAAVDAASVSITDTVTVLAKFPLVLPVTGLKAGDNIRTVTTGIVAGDNYGPARYVVREWLDAP